jgi:hypothetical protein
MYVQNPDSTDNSFFGCIRIRRLFLYSDPAVPGITGYRNLPDCSRYRPKAHELALESRDGPVLASLTRVLYPKTIYK